MFLSTREGRTQTHGLQGILDKAYSTALSPLVGWTGLRSGRRVVSVDKVARSAASPCPDRRARVQIERDRGSTGADRGSTGAALRGNLPRLLLCDLMYLGPNGATGAGKSNSLHIM
jgi:hypothetical protein